MATIFRFTIHTFTHLSSVLHKAFLPLFFFYVKYYQWRFHAFMLPNCCDSSILLRLGCNLRHPRWLQFSGLPYIPLPTFPLSLTKPFCHYSSSMSSTINVGSMHSCSLIVVTVAVCSLWAVIWGILSGYNGQVHHTYLYPPFLCPSQGLFASIILCQVINELPCIHVPSLLLQ